MKATIKIKFNRIGGIEINEKAETEQLINATKKTLDKLSNMLEKYFNEKKIETDITFILERGNIKYVG
jgi:hypothetical protein